jgi:flagella basal body P-ring formation protein FlgA
MNPLKISGFQAMLVTMVWLSSVETGHAAVIQLRRSASVSTTVVRLGDVADVLDNNPETVRTLKQIMLAPAPAAGRQVRLDFDVIRSRLQRLGINLAHLEFSGARFVTVSAAMPAQKDGLRGASRNVAKWKHERAQRLISEAIRQYLRLRAPELGNTVVVVDFEKKDVPLILKGAVSGYEIRDASPPWNVPQMLSVLFMDQKEKIHKVRVRCRISQQPRILTVKYTVPRGHVLQTSDLVWSQVETAGAGLTQIEDVVHKETTRTIRKDKPILRKDIRSIPLVRMNDIVTVYSRRPGITVREQLKARSEGSMGEHITLVTLDRRQKVLARVTGYHEAEVLGSSGLSARPQANATGGGIQFRSQISPRPNLTRTRGKRRLEFR